MIFLDWTSTHTLLLILNSKRTIPVTSTFLILYLVSDFSTNTKFEDFLLKDLLKTVRPCLLAISFSSACPNQRIPSTRENGMKDVSTRCTRTTLACVSGTISAHTEEQGSMCDSF
jgi:hypothetical protein